MPDIRELTFEGRFGLLVDREMTERRDMRLRVRLRLAASVEDIDYRQPRCLDKRLLLELTSCGWIKERQMPGCVQTLMRGRPGRHGAGSRLSRARGRASG